MSVRVYFNKLVRDNVVQLCLDDPEVLHIEYRELDDEVYFRELIAKLAEEASEVAAAETREERLREIADLQNVIDALREREGATEDEVRRIANAKTHKKGGFARRYYIEYVDLDEGSKWIDVFTQQPDKYDIQPDSTSNGREFPVIEPGRYVHSKSGKLYEVVGIALETEVETPLVIYQPLYDSEYQLFARPYDMFVESIELDGKMKPRFEKIEGSRDA